MGVFSSGRSGLKRIHQTIHGIGKSALHPFRFLCFFSPGIRAVRFIFTCFHIIGSCSLALVFVAALLVSFVLLVGGNRKTLVRK